MNREIKFRFWDGKRMYTEQNGVIECLRQQHLVAEDLHAYRVDALGNTWVREKICRPIDTEYREETGEQEA